ncbi:pyruvate, phosphate dikinase [Candidatus Peregrinibacteria bacterium]|nr:pyruvate, phosphate dikinase [Candidatus Peregrinibacteria bacterium]
MENLKENIEDSRLTQPIYSFEEGAVLFNEDEKDLRKTLLGGKGANLAEMTDMNISVPPGFIITTEVCDLYLRNGKFPEGFEDQVKTYMALLETQMNREFGNSKNPLLVSVRSGAKASMPGMMETILNLGLNDKTVEAIVKQTKNRWFAYDIYCRFIQMFIDVVMGIDRSNFETALEVLKAKRQVSRDADLNAKDLETLAKRYKQIIEKRAKQPFPEDSWQQLYSAIEAVFKSWNSPKAKAYREIKKIRGLKGTAVNIQAMVFGNMSELDSGTGVVFTRNPNTGESKPFGNFLLNAQGEDIVSGTRDAEPINKLEEAMKDIHGQLMTILAQLDEHFKDMQDVEFTIEKRKLFILQTRDGKRTAYAALKIATDLVKEKRLSKEEVLLKLDPTQLDHLLHKRIDPNAPKQIIAKGLGASPGGACGKAVFSSEKAEEWAKKGEKVLLFRPETVTDDIRGMEASQGILTSRGGLGAHAALVSRDRGKPCIVGCSALEFDWKNMKAFITEGDKVHEINEGDYLTIDGSTGEVMLGQVPMLDPELPEDFYTIMEWADEIRKLRVRVNTETPEGCKKALDLGAEGIGLARTEHMLLDPKKLSIFRRVILAQSKEEKSRALEDFLKIQREDIKEIISIMSGYPVLVRLLDPPLHEFLPKEEDKIQALASEMGMDVESLKKNIEGLREANPMLGHRGCRLGITHPEIYEAQVKAILEAAIEVSENGKDPRPEIEVPLVGDVNELLEMRCLIEKVIESYKDRIKFDYKIGTMIELPSACLTADELAPHADFFSFGTNDLTQTSLGVSRDDYKKFIDKYLEKEIFENDPFAVLDKKSVGKLMKIAVEDGRAVKPNLEVGICGEHGGDPESIELCHSLGLDYVSCSPFRVPGARLAAAQAVIREKGLSIQGKV